MNALGIVVLALTRIWANRARSALTALGVLVGVAALIALTSAAGGATQSITASLGQLGSTTITVQADASEQLTSSDADALAALPGVEVAASSVTGTGTVRLGDRVATVRLVGASANYQRATAPSIAFGRYLPGFDGADDSSTVVLDASAARALGVDDHDIGSAVDIDGTAFLLVGVLADSTGFGATGVATVPLSTARRLFAPAASVSTITIVADRRDDVAGLQAATDATLRLRHRLAAADDAPFTTTTLASVLQTVDKVDGELSLLLGGISGISLVVGGIGILNILLVSVRERTREIGVRRAVGARRVHVLAQFLVEAVTLSLLGGVLGVGAGIGLGAVIAAAAGWTLSVSIQTVLLGLVFSATVGVVFGSWPAYRASRLEPIDALRFE